MVRRENGLMKLNVFDKPNPDELARMVRRENGLMKLNVFDKPNPDELARMVRRENGLMKLNVLFQQVRCKTPKEEDA